MRILFYILSFVVLNAFDANAQTATLYFKTIGIKDGLPTNVVSSVVQDETGFVWIGTEEGLCRYDGYSMKYFNADPNPASIPSNRISTLLLDGKTLWVGTWDGLCTISTETFEIEQVNTGTLNGIRSLYKDSKGHVWIGTTNGLLRYDKKHNRFHYYSARKSGLSHNTIRCIYEDEQENLWVGTYDKLNRFRRDTFEVFDLKGTYKPQLENNLILSVFPSKTKRKLWIGTETGLCLFDTKTGDYEHFHQENTGFSNEVIKCIYRVGNHLFLGTDFGLNRFDVTTKQVNSFFHNPVVNYSISNNVISSIFKDRNDLLWFVTSNGISLLKQDQDHYGIHEEFYSVGGQKAGNQIRDIFIDNEQNTWLATVHGVVWKGNNNDSKKIFSSDNSYKLLLDNTHCVNQTQDGRVWIGTAGGINIWDAVNSRMESVTANRKNGLKSNYISDIAFVDGALWVSAWEGGLYRAIGNLHDAKSLRFQSINSSGGGKILSKQNKLYYAQQWELFEIDPLSLNSITVANVRKKMGDVPISCIGLGQDSLIWIGGEGIALSYNIETQQTIKFTLQNGKKLKPVSMEQDNLGGLWFATGQQIMRLNISSGQLRELPLPQNIPIRGFQAHCCTLSASGEIFFGGDNGYITVFPDAMSDEAVLGEAKISALKINNEQLQDIDKKLLGMDLGFSEKIILEHTQNSVSFYFSSLDYYAPEKQNYQYKLENFDNDWKFTADKTNFAAYPKLPAGSYTLKVKKTQGERISQLKIRIKPPFWLSVPFLAFYLLLFTGLLYAVFRFYIYRQKLRTALRLAKLETQHAEELMNAKLRFFTNISHEFRTPLSLIVPPIRQLLQAEGLQEGEQKLLRLAHKNSQRLLRLVNQILDFRKMEKTQLRLATTPTDFVQLAKDVFDSFSDLAQRNEIRYSFGSEMKHLILEIDVEKVETILFNLLSNAFKYTPAEGAVTVEIKKSKDEICVSVNDSGSGIKNEDQTRIFERFFQTVSNGQQKTGSGIGLTLSLEYAKLHGGKIELESEFGKGSCFKLILPQSLALTQEEAQVSQLLPARPELSFPAKKAPADAKKLLIIDDNEDILDFIELNLQENYRLERATNGKIGLEKTDSFRPDLILSDVMMPIMDGIELCKNIKENASTAHIPVILLTAKSLGVQKVEGLRTGADLYVTKPFEIDFLVASIESLFRREEQILQYIQKDLLISPKPSNGPEANQEQIFLKKVMRIVEENVSNPDLSVEMISREVGISTTHLYRRLKALTDKSTKDIIKSYRLQKAAQMLANNEGNVTEVMYAIGFSSPSSFSKSFKALYGCSPSEYKSAVR